MKTKYTRIYLRVIDILSTKIVRVNDEYWIKSTTVLLKFEYLLNIEILYLDLSIDCTFSDHNYK